MRVRVSRSGLDTDEVEFRGERLTESRAEAVAADVLARTPGRPSFSGEQVSPSLTVRLADADRQLLDKVATRQGRRPSEVVRQALTEYLAKNAG